MIQGHIYCDCCYYFNHQYYYYFPLPRIQTKTKASYLNVITLFSILEVPINAGFGRMLIPK